MQELQFASELLKNLNDEQILEYFNSQKKGKGKSPYEVVVQKLIGFYNGMSKNTHILNVPVFQEGSDASTGSPLPLNLSKKNIKLFRTFVERFISDFSQNITKVIAPNVIAKTCWDSIQGLDTQEVIINPLENCMDIIAIQGKFIKYYLNQRGSSIQEQINLDKTYHITINYNFDQHMVSGVFHEVKMVGIGNFTDESGKNYSWIVVSVDGHTKSPITGRNYHISIKYPPRCAGNINELAGDPSNNIMFEEESATLNLVSFPVLKKKMDQGITKEHVSIGCDFDNSGAVVDVQKLISDGHPSISVDESGNITNYEWLKNPEVAESYTVYSKLGISLMISFGEINFFTSRRMNSELESSLEQIFQVKADQMFEPKMVKINFSTQKIKAFDKKHQAADKLKRAHLVLSPEHLIFCEDNVITYHEMIQSGFPVIKVENNGDSTSLLRPECQRKAIPHVIGLIGPISIGKSTIFSEMMRLADEQGIKYSFYSTDEINAQKIVKNAYEYINNQIRKMNGGLVFVDTGFTSGIPDWLNHPIQLNHNSNTEFLTGLSLFRAMLRRDHPVLTFNQIEGLEQFYVSEPVDEIESTVKDARSEMNADQLMNSFETFQDLVLFLDERSHYCRAEGLDQYGNPQHGSTLVAGYLHEGAKNFRDKWGLEMRHRAYTFVKDKWVCHKPGFPIGVEVGEFSEDYTPETYSRLHHYHQTVIEMINGQKTFPGPEVDKNPKMSWKVDGQFYQIIVMIGEIEAIWRNLIQKNGDKFSKSLEEFTRDKGYLLVVATNGTSHLHNEYMWHQLITSICGFNGLKTSDYSGQNPFDVWTNNVLPFMEQFGNAYLALSIEPTCEVPLAVNWEGTTEGRKNPWDLKVATELASLEHSGFKATAVIVNGELHPHYQYSEWLKEFKFDEPGVRDTPSGKSIEDLKMACNKIIEYPSRDGRDLLIKKMMADYGFPENCTFHPEGWVLFVWIDNQWVYCKIKIDWFYPCHRPLKDSLLKVITLPRVAEDFYPKVGEAYNFVETTNKTIPTMIQNINDFLPKYISDFYQIGISYNGPDDKYADYLKAFANSEHPEYNVLFKMDYKALTSMIKNRSKSSYATDIKRIFNNRLVSNLAGCSEVQQLYYVLANAVIPESSHYIKFLEHESDEVKNELFMLLKHLVLTPNLDADIDLTSTLSEKEVDEFKKKIKNKHLTQEERDAAKIVVNRNEGIIKILEHLYRLA
jgi:hypothetical protein